MSKNNNQRTIFTLIKVLLICLDLTLTASSNCEDVSIDPKLSCWTSCSFGNCGKENIDTHAFLKCSWIVLLDNVTRTYSLYIYFDNDPDKTCTYTSPCDNVETDNGETGICIGTILYSECSYMKDTKRITPALIISDENDEELCVDTATPHSLCEIAKPDPPIILGVSKKPESQELLVNVGDPACVEENSISLYYVINYTRFDGETEDYFPYGDESITPFMIFKEASEYNFTIRSTVEQYVYSDPATNHTVTEPETAVEEGSVIFYCGQSANGLFDLDLSWKKIGVVDYFEVKAKRIISELPTVEQTKDILQQFKTQVYYNTVLKDLMAMEQYEITIVAVNDGGQSPPHVILFGDGMCTPIDNISCRVKNTGKTWIDVGWDLVDMYSFLTCGYTVEMIDAKDTRITVATLSPDDNSWNQTKLQQCVVYDFVVCSECNDVIMSCCSLSHYADEVAAPKASPEFEVTEIKHDYFTIHVIEDSLNETVACGIINGYSVKYSPCSTRDQDTTAESSVFSKELMVVVPGLTPNTEYNFQIAAVNEGGEGVLSPIQLITTEQAAPSDPPYLDPPPKLSGNKLEVSWQPPVTPNGIVNRYNLRVSTHSDTSDLNTNCTFEAGSSILDCTYNGSVLSTVLTLSQANNITIRACTGNGSLCSSWSQPSPVQQYSAGSSPIGIIILCVVCAIAVIAFLAVAVLYRCSSTGEQAVEPKVHPSIMKEFDTKKRGKMKKTNESDVSCSKQIKSKTYRYKEIAENDASEDEGIQCDRLSNSRSGEVFEEMLPKIRSEIDSQQF